MKNVTPSDSHHFLGSNETKNLFKKPAIYIALIIPFLIAIFHAYSLLPSKAPFEDSAMLMRYSENISHGHGIRWNINQPPVDGGTDFLYMITLGGFNAINSYGIIKNASGLLNITKAVFIALLIIWILNFSIKKVLYLPSALLIILIFGPGFWYTRAYFPTLFFSIFIILSYCLLFEPSFSKQQGFKELKIGYAFPICSLLMGLARPEGVFLAIFMLIGFYIAEGKKAGWQLTKKFLLIFGTFGTAYFAWRWWYFGHPLPNPFYKKSGGGLHLTSLKISISNVIKFGAPFIVIILLTIKKFTRQTIGQLTPIVLFTLIWILISNEMNYMGRFQYPVFIMLAMLAIFQTRHISSWIKSQPALIAISIILAFAGSFYLNNLCEAKSKEFYYDPNPAGRYDIANTLSQFKDKGYTIAVTEAGLLPLYSKWNAIDCWGLNDSWIAQNKQISPEYLDKFKPEVIMIHKTPVSDLPGWPKMCKILENYAKSHDYILAASFGRTPKETHDYYIRSNFNDSKALIKIFETYPYIWFKDRKRAINFATLKDGKDVNRDLPK